MKKRGALILLLIICFSIILIPLLASASTDKVSDAYQWLYLQRSNPLSSDELSFLLLAFSYNDTVSSKLIASLDLKSSNQNESWGNNITKTAYAVLALRAAGMDTTKAEEWLIKRRKPTASNLDWYLQIDPLSQTKDINCTISYNSGDSNVVVTIQKNKAYNLVSDASSCFSVEKSYWLKIIGQSCKNQTFFISCDESSYVSLLYKDVNSYNLQSTAKLADPDTDISIESSCLGISDCDYQGTLWAAYALTVAGRDVDAEDLLPYLISPNINTFDITQRDAILALISSGKERYENNLLKNQSNQGYWPKSSLNPFDSAVAVNALAQDYFTSGNMTKFIYYWNRTWTEENNWGIQATALILYSLFPQRYSTECEKNKVLNPRLGFKCSELPQGPDYILNETLSCISTQGTELVSLGNCYQLSPCALAGGICNSSDMGSSFYTLDLQCEDYRFQCWNASLCATNHGTCASSCNSQTHIMNSTYNSSCGTNNVCCQETLCSQLGGKCKASGEVYEIENTSLSKSCGGLKCWLNSPCSVGNFTCYQGTCPSSFSPKKSLACNAGAICCQEAHPLPCTFNCKAQCSLIEQPFNFLCSGDNVCCEQTDTCTQNTAGYSCKASCSQNETLASNLICPYTTGGQGICCKPDYQCAAANDTCRGACLANEKSNALSCLGGQSCCEAVPTNTCEQVYGFSCKPTCTSAEDTMTPSSKYSCFSGICCKPKDTNISCQTLSDCRYKSECNNQIVSDLFGRYGKCEYSRETACNDNFDNDGDGFVDGEDPDCPTCSNQGYTCCKECDAGFSQSGYDLSCSGNVCCEKCKSAAVTCASQGYECCDSCVSGTERATYDTSCSNKICCAQCKSKSNIILYIVLGVLILGIIAAGYFLVIKKRKPGTRAPLPPGMGFRPAVRPYTPPAQASRPMPAPMTTGQVHLRQPELKPRLTKTESQLEETLKKLKKISE
jgi:hypothetical protein